MYPTYEPALATNEVPTYPEVPAGDIDLEAAWLWFAAQAATDAARRYCMEQALRANPNSRVARKVLAALTPDAA